MASTNDMMNFDDCFSETSLECRIATSGENRSKFNGTNLEIRNKIEHAEAKVAIGQIDAMTVDSEK
jgi:hypothetical protein